MAEEGMWQGLLAGYQDVEAKRVAREQKEEELLKRRREIANRLRPQLQENARQVEEMRARATYLLDRGLPQETINALGEDPEMLNTAYTYAREGVGADVPPEQLQEIFKVSTLSGASGPRDFMTTLNATSEVYRDALSGDTDLETFTDPLSATTPRTSIVEARIPEAPTRREPGLTATMERTYNAQTEVFDNTLLTLVNSEFQELQRKQDNQTITPEENTRRVELERDLNNYSSDLDTRVRLTEQYRDPVVQLMMSDIERNPNLYVGFESNPIIFSPASQQALEILQAPQTDTPQGPEGGILYGTGTDPEDGKFKYIYKMPDGTYQFIEG